TRCVAPEMGASRESVVAGPRRRGRAAVLRAAVRAVAPALVRAWPRRAGFRGFLFMARPPRRDEGPPPPITPRAPARVRRRGSRARRARPPAARAVGRRG